MPRYSSIRQISAPFDGPRIATGDREGVVRIWDVRGRTQVSAFETPLDQGAGRLAINPRGDLCALTSGVYKRLACYVADSGDVACIRDDLRKPYGVSYSPDGSRLYCSVEGGPMAVLDAETGGDLDRYRATSRVFCSPFESLELRDTRTVAELRQAGGKAVAKVARTTFAILHAAFGPDRFCLSESGGPVRCLATADGSELWQYSPRPNRHVLELAYSPTYAAFFGVEWPYVSGGPKRVLRFHAGTGEVSPVIAIEKPAAGQVFGSQGELLVTTEGEAIDVVAGRLGPAFAFPP